MKVLFFSVLIFFSSEVFSNHPFHGRGAQIPVGGITGFPSALSTDFISKVKSIETQYGEFEYEVHTPPEKVIFGNEVARIIEQDAPKVIEYFKVVPQTPVHFIIDGVSRVANGMASPFPHNMIQIIDFPPVGEGHLSASQDWLRVLVLHELVHAIHMDQTSGFPQFLRFFLGSAAKFNSIVPRWFSEGIAVWAETHFTGEGRLSYQPFRSEFIKFLSRDDYCQNIGCLDNPGRYPFYQFPYWAGAFFAEFLEIKKPGSLSCLLRANSDSIPFFLNSAFKECLGRTAEDLFVQFRQFYLDQQDRENGAWENIKELRFADRLNNSFINWQKGFEVYDDQLLSFWSSGRHAVDFREKVVLKNLKSNQIKQDELSFPIEQIIRKAGSFSKKDPLKNDQTALLIRRESYDLAAERSLHRYGIGTGSVSKILEDDGDYFFETATGTYLSLKYEAGQWSLFHHYSYEGKKRLYTFPKLISIQDPRSFIHRKQTHLGFVLTYLGDQSAMPERHEYVLLDLTHYLKKEGNALSSLSAKTIYKDSEPFRYLENCGTNFIFKKEKEKSIGSSLIIASLSDLKNGSDIQNDERKGPYISEISHLRFSDNSQAIWASSERKSGLGVAAVHGSCQKVVDLIRRKSYSKKSFASKVTPSASDKWESVSKGQRKVARKIFQTQDWRDYPRLSHFYPRYLFLSYGYGFGTPVAGAHTSLVDPAGRHSVGLDALYYPEISQQGGSVRYTYQAGQFFFGPGYEQTYSDNDLSPIDNKSEVVSFSFGRRFDVNRFSLSPALYASKEKVVDFVSSREMTSYGMRSIFSHTSWWPKSFYRNWFFDSRVFKNNAKNLENYWGVELKTVFHFQLASWLRTRLQSSYGRLDKNDFISGVLYGGGAAASPVGGQNFHEFYGEGYTDIYGNEIVTNRVQLEVMLNQHHRSSGFFPVMTKRWSLVIGGDQVHASRVFTDKRVYAQKQLLSAYGGARFNGNIAYLFPLELDMLFTKTFENKEKQTGFLFLMKQDFMDF